MDNPLIGILLVGETNSQGNHVGLVHLPTSSRNQILSQFRPVLKTSLSSTLKGVPFIFLTSHGWEISEVLEDQVRLCDVISSEGVIRVRISHPKPKYGITIEGYSEAAVPAGFLFCEPNISIIQVRNEIKQQLPLLYQFLSTVHFAFLDLNSWPISREQESLVTVLEVTSLHVIRIRCARPPVDKEASIDLAKQSIQSIESSRPASDSVTSVNFLDPSASLLQPITEVMEYADSSPLDLAPDFKSLHRSSTKGSFEILISYVHTEGSSYALLLKNALEDLGYTVFLDVHCIQGGTDWQDALNDAISDCSLFVPLITLQYGQTLWTNREVKLADVLGKIIIPVNFLSSWPPKCLAIQFATTQFVTGMQHHIGPDIPDDIGSEMVVEVAADIAKRYSLEKMASESFDIHVPADNDDLPMSLNSSLSHEDTQLINDDALSDKNSGSSVSMYASAPPSQLLIRKKSSIRSYASSLPSAVDATYRESITKSRDGKPLIVICCATEQKDFAHSLVDDLNLKEYETWCSCDIDSSQDEENARVTFQRKADEAGIVVFVLSQEFSTSSFCEQQVYYCEQRKRIIPLIYKPMQLPNWMAMLIGTSTFIDCQAQSYKSTLLERVDTLFSPQKAEDELKQSLKQKVELANMCSQLSEELPKGKHVYVSGGTQFYSKSGEEICKALGEELAKDDDIVLVTGGFYGVGETVSRSFYEERMRLNKPHGVCHVVAKKDKQDKSNQTRQNPDGTFARVPFGDTLFFGESVRQREMLTPRVVDLCVLVEGGPGAAFEAQQFTWNGNRVIPVKVTGGAASGLFNVPASIFVRPPNVKELHWSLLADSNASPVEIASALFKIVQAVKSPSFSSRSRSSSTSDPRLKKRVSIKRSDTLPLKDDQASETESTLQAVKRALTESEAAIRKQN